MSNIRNIKNKVINCIGLVLVLSSFAVTVKAETKTSGNKDDYGLPTHRRDGGSRSNTDNCVANTENLNLVALVPEKTMGINASASPKLFFYVPKVTSQKTLEFVLRNEQDELMYEAFLITKGEGIMSVEVPTNVKSSLLEKDQNYHWYLSMICDSQQRSKDIVVEGWLRQASVDVAIEQELNSGNYIEQAELYHEQGFWYDALSILASQSQNKPTVQAKWLELLESVGLEDFAAKPFVESQIIEANFSQSTN